MIASLIIAALVLALAVYFNLPRYRAYVEKVSASGYVHSTPTEGWTRFLRGFSRCITFIQVGRIEVTGIENIPKGAVLITPNHGGNIDPGIICLAIRRPARFLAARRLFKFMGGIFAGLCANTGAISVDLRRGKGRPAFDASVEVLARGETLVMFPEGYAYVDGVMGPLRTGAPRIVKEASSRVNHPVYTVPTCIRYGRNPGSWIRKWNEPNQYFWVFLNFWYYRRGVKVVFGKPILSSEFPEDPYKAADFLAARIAELDPKHELKPLPSGVNLPYPSDDQE